jgi:hypothetical protein
MPVDKTGDPLLHELENQINPEFDLAGVNVVMDLVIGTILTAESAGATRDEMLYALTGVLISMIRSDKRHKMDMLALVQRMITLRMTWGEHLDARATTVN